MSNREGLRNDPKLTEEGREFQLQNVNNNRDALIKSMDKRIATLNELMETVTNYQIVKQELSNLDFDLQEFHNFSTRIKTLIEGDNVNVDEILVNKIDERIFNEKTKVLKWIRQYDESVQTKVNNSPSRSSHRSSHRSSNRSSQRSSRSSKSAKDMFMQETAKMAALQAEAEFKSKLVLIESQRKKIRRRRSKAQ